ncbi:nucleotidyltransferase family protein [Streptomyces prunicolor]|uniref:nucleotidyltransferase family protein n=1 Tax=Streptomyces prunicolor TaxID=67348 RepID=UPI00341D690D
MTSPASTDRVWRLLELISVANGPDSPESKSAVDLFQTGELDMNELLGRAARQALLPAVADLLVQGNLLDRVPKHIRAHMVGTLDWNKYRTHAYVREAARIAEAFDQKVPVVFNKGAILQASLYGGRGTRYFGDIDLMIHPQDKEATAELLAGLGYLAAKRFDVKTGELHDLPRSEKLMYSLYPDHLPHVHRLTGEPHLPFFMVDIAFNISWFGSRWQLPMDEVLSNAQWVPVSQADTLPALSGAYGFVFLVLHTFREAWFERTIRRGAVRLTQFADILRYWRKYEAQHGSEIRALTERHRLGPVMAWVLHHVDQIYHAGVTEEFGGLGAFRDEDWFRSAGAVDGGHLAWHGDMRQRLCDDQELALTPTAEPRFASDARVSTGA